jgi:hypothetical protein
MQAWPNPFKPTGGTLKISCLPPTATVSIYTLSGEWVTKLEAIGGLASWDGKNHNGFQVSIGIYYYVILQGGQALKVDKLIVAP